MKMLLRRLLLIRKNNPPLLSLHKFTPLFTLSAMMYEYYEKLPSEIYPLFDLQLKISKGYETES